MPWKKLGQIEFDIKKIGGHSHLTFPTVSCLKNLFRVYFACRDNKNISRAYYLDLDNNFKVINFSSSPFLNIGDLGSFDESGVIITSYIHEKDRTLFYYHGYKVRQTIPYDINIGLVISDDYTDKKINKFNGPILHPNYKEPYQAACPFVIKKDSGYFMYYTGFEKWVNADNSIEPYCVIKTATSNNGIDWDYSNKSIIKKNIPMNV